MPCIRFVRALFWHAAHFCAVREQLANIPPFITGRHRSGKKVMPVMHRPAALLGYAQRRARRMRCDDQSGGVNRRSCDALRRVSAVLGIASTLGSSPRGQCSGEPLVVLGLRKIIWCFREMRDETTNAITWLMLDDGKLAFLGSCDHAL